MFMDIDALCTPDRVLFLTPTQYKYWEMAQRGYGVREIARHFDVSAATVSKCLKAARQNLEKQRGENDG